MSSSELDQKIEIKSKIKVLRSDELAALRNVKVEPCLHMGIKRTVPHGTQEEQEDLQKLYDNLRQKLSFPRIDSIGKRSLGVWSEEAQTVEILRKDSKFGNFGYSHNGKHYVEYFEAMFLLELGRLQLEYHSMVMSVEQAYLLLLGEAASPKYNEYLVYSKFSRVGYIVMKHRNVRFGVEHVEPTKTDCIWQVLFSSLQNKSTPKYITKTPYYEKIKNNMESIKASIIQQQTAASIEDVTTKEAHIDFNRKLQSIGKRRACDDDNYSKRHCTTEAQGVGHSLLDFLRDEPEYKQFKYIFQSFEIIKLKTTVTADDCSRNLHINFDLYLHNDGFKKSIPKAPIFRVIILDVGDLFPTNAEISLCHRQQLHPVPLLVVSVSASKQIHAFIYSFA